MIVNYVNVDIRSVIHDNELYSNKKSLDLKIFKKTISRVNC